MIYKCSICDLNFHSNTLEYVVKINKRCLKCRQEIAYKRTPVSTLTQNDIIKAPGKKTCMRCHVGLDKDLKMCPVCDCVEFTVRGKLNVNNS